MCGEKASTAGHCSANTGSPPHVRGKGQSILPLHQRDGITPACAGKSTIGGTSGLANGDHPRMCGEKQRTHRCAGDHGGSPPHMRGKGRNGCKLHKPERITPAYAGKSRLRRFAAACYGDHPRICGEKSPWLRRQSTSSGSPPHMRGKGGEEMTMKPEYRITPAYAGKSASPVPVASYE